MSVLFPKQIWSCIANFLFIQGIHEKSHFPTILISLNSAVVCHWEGLRSGRKFAKVEEKSESLLSKPKNDGNIQLF